LLRQQLGSLVVDLSLLGEEQPAGYAAELLQALYDGRSRTGLPQWILVDEALAPEVHKHTDPIILIVHFLGLVAGLGLLWLMRLALIS